MNTMTYNGYAARIEFDDEDDIFVGHIAGIRDIIGFHSDTVGGLRNAFKEAVDSYLDTCRNTGQAANRPYSGQLMVRVDPQVHARAALAAELSGKSLAKWTEERLREDAERELKSV